MSTLAAGDLLFSTRLYGIDPEISSQWSRKAIDGFSLMVDDCFSLMNQVLTMIGASSLICFRKALFISLYPKISQKSLLQKIPLIFTS